jgi:MFS family permease
MGSSRVFYAKFSKHIRLGKFMLGCGALCILSFLVTALSPSPIVSLIGCAVCGLSVGIMWPGGLSTAAGLLPGSVSLFATLALAGDIGCLVGPTVVGNLSELFGGNFRLSFLCATFFPLMLIAALLYIDHLKKKEAQKKS